MKLVDLVGFIEKKLAFRWCHVACPVRWDQLHGQLENKDLCVCRCSVWDMVGHGTRDVRK